MADKYLRARTVWHMLWHMSVVGPTPMAAERHVKLFRNGRNRAIRIPRELEIEGDEAIIRKEGNRLIVEPIHKTGLLGVLSSLKPVEDEFPDIDSDLGKLDEVNLLPDA